MEDQSSASNSSNKNDSSDLILRKRIINHRNKQIETRIQRKIVMEDGVMVSDSGPVVTTKTVEDNRQELEEFGPFDNIKTNNNSNKNDLPSNADGNNVIKGSKSVSVTSDQKPCRNIETYLFGHKDKPPTKPIPKYYFGHEIKHLKTDDNITDNKNDFRERDCQYVYHYASNISRPHFAKGDNSSF